MSDLQQESTQRWARLAGGGGDGGALRIGYLTSSLTTGGSANFHPVKPTVNDDDDPVPEINTSKTLKVYDLTFLEAFNSPLAANTYIYYTKIKGKNWYVRHACSS